MTKDKVLDIFMKYNRRSRAMLRAMLAWDTKKTIAENAKIADITYPVATSILRKYKLKHKRGYRTDQTINPLNARPGLFKDLVAAGASYSAIGRLFGLSRERIGQIARSHKNGHAPVAPKPKRRKLGRSTKPGPIRAKIYKAIKEEPMAAAQIKALFPKLPKDRIQHTLHNMAQAKDIVNVAGRWAVPH